MVIKQPPDLGAGFFHKNYINWNTMKNYDVVIIGAGASGLMAAAELARCGRRVAVIDMGTTPGRKVAASGGGRCNITNMAVAHNRYFGENVNFVRSALANTKPGDILDWMAAHNLSTVEKAPGQYFCVQGADAVVDALVRDANGADIKYETVVESADFKDGKFIIRSNRGDFSAEKLIVATGGTSFSALGVSDIGYKIAKHFGHKIIPVRPALCAMAIKGFDSDLAGVATDVEIMVGREVITDALLFTHFGIGGPAVYRASVRDFSDGITINFCPGQDIAQILRDAKHTMGKKSIAGVLEMHMPKRLARHFAQNDERRIADIPDKDILKIANSVSQFKIEAEKIKLHNLQSAEVVRGGVSTDKISSKTMESQLQPGLFFIGEVLDIAGDLGGFNLHWAWASARIAAQYA